MRPDEMTGSGNGTRVDATPVKQKTNGFGMSQPPQSIERETPASRARRGTPHTYNLKELSDAQRADRARKASHALPPPAFKVPQRPPAPERDVSLSDPWRMKGLHKAASSGGLVGASKRKLSDAFSSSTGKQDGPSPKKPAQDFAKSQVAMRNPFKESTTALNGSQKPTRAANSSGALQRPASASSSESVEMVQTPRPAGFPKQRRPTSSDGTNVSDMKVKSESQALQRTSSPRERSVVHLPFHTSPSSWNGIDENSHDQGVGETRGITLTAGGRPYAMFQPPFKEEGDWESGKGALFPNGYQLDDNKTYPFVCPVRSCRKMFPKILNIGTHFVRRHKADALRDNQDGTFSVVSQAAERTKAIVVSRGPVDPDEPPMPAPSLPLAQLSSLKDKRTDQHPAQSGSEPHPVAANAATPEQSSRPSRFEKTAHIHAAKGDPYGTWAYMKSLLTTHDESVLSKSHLPALIQLPRVRDFAAKENSRSQYSDKRLESVLALAIYVTGIEAPKPCGTCSGPFKDCVLLSTAAPSYLKPVITGCANCYYHKSQARCSHWVRNTGSGQGQSFDKRSASQSSEEAPAKTTRDEKKAQRNDNLTASGRGNQGRAAEEPVAEGSHASNTTTRQLRPLGFRSGDLPRRPAALPVEDEDEDMADWEVAPGRIRDETAPDIENIAFSSTYLASAHPVDVHPHIGFHNVDIRGGTTHRFEADPEAVRMCAVACGKVWVKMGEQQDYFPQGPHGMFKIAAGTVCRVQNRSHPWATIMVCAVNEAGIED